MSYEMKDILKTMIDNNEPHWSADTMDMVRVELDHVYRQAEKAAKVDEYEAKAKAFDDIVAAYENNTGLGEHDEDLTDFEAIVDSIEHGIQMGDIEKTRRNDDDDEYEKSKYRNHVNDYKSEAFDAILKSYDEALSEGHMADDVCNIIQKYESGEE